MNDNCDPNNEILTYDQALEYLGIEDFWLDELLLTGVLKSLSIEDIEEYFANAPTEEIEKDKEK
jgi:hypothetical protein